MKLMVYLLEIILIIPCFLHVGISKESEDPFLWLEEIEGDRAMEWVNAQNKSIISDLEKYHDYDKINQKIMGILNSKERIAYPSIRGDYIYNFWQDENNQRGLWRRTSLDEYFNESPKWETVLDIDVLCKNEGEKWVFKGASFLYPNYNICMLKLSKGGGDAVVMREFDLKKKSFVKNGFFLPEAKGQVSWIDNNTLLVSTDFGNGTTTESGYPRITKIWKRGSKLVDAKVFFEGKIKDISSRGIVINSPERQYIGVQRGISFYTSWTYLEENGKLIKLDIPEDCEFGGFFKNNMLIQLKSDWTIAGNIYLQGALLSIDYNKYLKGSRNFTVIAVPDARSSISTYVKTKNTLLINMLTNVSSELFQYSLIDGKWKKHKVSAPDLGRITVNAVDKFSDDYFFSYQNFLNPSALYYVHGECNEIFEVKNLPHFFDESGLEVKQYEAVSKDGVKIPYFIVASKTMKKNAANPTLIYAYGGFEVSLLPRYNAIIGASWLEQGGVYILANIRGGGEFGPKWHQAGLKENRQIVFNDFYAVSEDLIKRKITSPKHLGIIGGSNGGLLVGVAFTQRPELYNAVVCAVPLLDMKRYNKLLAGASWMAEYGNPDIPEEWAYIKEYSPYQNVFKSKKYPKVLFATTTKDDRVHPGHARKMAAKMAAQGHPIYYFENTEGGHGSGVTIKERALMISLEYTYLLKMLK